jgi:hypothetical protein
MSDGCAKLRAMRECECGCVVVASDEPEPMGDRLIHYARPLLREYAGDLNFEEFKAIFEFAAFLWNLTAPEDAQQAVRHLEKEMPASLRIGAPKASMVVRDMLTRRRSVEFGEDTRVALRVSLRRRSGRISVKALGVRLEPGPSREASTPDHAGDVTPKANRLLH